MPTPVTSARQCLTTEAAFALDEAVSVARRRGHTQTMSLHAIYSLFSLPNSSLREACTYARNFAYSPRLQFKALELSLSVSLDRIPSARPPVEEPPVSNSLMAAIKRSQANQKRHPENYHMYRQIQLQLQSGSAVSCIKVELQHLILAMLDDPVVSRVFGEAGFRSCDIKMAVMRLHPCFNGYSYSRDPPMFLSNLHKDASSCIDNLGNRFPTPMGLLDADVNHKRICDILVKSKGRNPLLVGVCAYNAMKSFTESLAQKPYSSLPVELSGIYSICIEKEVSKFFLNSPDDSETLKMRLEDITKLANESTAKRLIVDIGDLHSLLVEHPAVDSTDHIILQVTELLSANVGKLWIIGSVINYEMYLKFVAKFPSIENDWDLQLLPISALRPASGVNTNSRSPSLMESFIPFGGFFTTPDIKCSLSSNISHGHLQESSVITTDLNGGGLMSSSAYKYCPSLPSWLKVAELGTNSRVKSFKTKNDLTCITPSVAGTLRASTCAYECVHPLEPLDELESSKVGSGSQSIAGFHFGKDENKGVGHSGGDPRDININHSFSETNKGSLLSKLLEKPSKLQHIESSSFGYPCSKSYTFDGHSSSTSQKTSVTTTLGLSFGSLPTPEPESKHTIMHLVSDFISDRNNTASIQDHSTQQSSSGSTSSEQRNSEKFKKLFRGLSQRLPQQEEAIGVICKTLVSSRMAGDSPKSASPVRGIWLGLLGPESWCKKSIVVPIAELLWGEHGNVVYVDSNSSVKKGVGRKTCIDYIADALNKKPFSVVFLEDVDNADVLLRSTLSSAVRTGKFMDSHGRDVSTSNAIFVAASGVISKNQQPIQRDSVYFNEMRILKAKGRAFRILHGQNSHQTDRVAVQTPPVFKRKLADADVSALEQLELIEAGKRIFKQASDSLFDLNLPATVDNDVDQMIDCNSFNDENHCQSSKIWLEDFMNHMDETVEFKPFDFDSLASKISKQMTDALHDTVGSEHLLEIDTDVLDQILAVAYTSDSLVIVDNWIRMVLTKHFKEAKTRYDFSSPSVVKLATCNLVYTVDMSPFLPSSINLS